MLCPRGKGAAFRPGPPIRQDPAGPGLDDLALPVAGSRRRAMLSADCRCHPRGQGVGEAAPLPRGRP
ncbi:Hypothetical protein RMHFA_05663 [Roseomonas mucosa]|nr:Hypothetical protein RMHFA_05663 [Roseomonas mucosa]